MAEYQANVGPVSLNQKQLHDLVKVLAVVWKAAEGETTWVEGHLRPGGRYPRQRAPRQLVKVCGHELLLAGDRPFSVGGSGIVLPCIEANAPKVGYALKVARPSLFSTKPKADAELAKAQEEYINHLPLAHENIAKMLASDKLELRFSRSLTLELPCTLIEWIDGAVPLDTYITAHVNDPYQLADLVLQACRALGHLHDSGKVHWDMKGENVLVGNGGVVKLMDLGNARELRQPGTRYSRREHAESTDRNLPRRLQERRRSVAAAAVSKAREQSSISNNRIPVQLNRHELVWDQPWLDLYMLGREINRLLAFDDATLELDGLERQQLVQLQTARDRIFADEEGDYVMRYLRQLFRRILAAGDPAVAPFYASAHEIVEMLERLRPEYGAATDIPELQPVPQHVLRVPPTLNVPWTGRIEALMTSAPLKRLKKHRQLATVHHVFPGAEHMRWEHVAGTFETVLQYVRALYADRSSVLFRLETSKLDIVALMLATLIHDLGHPAFGHQLEESPAVPFDLHHEQYALSVLRACLSDATPPHDLTPVDEDAAADAWIIRDLLETHWRAEESEVDDLVQRAIEILGAGASVASQHRQEDAVSRARRVHTEVLGSLVIGQLDADKADYLIRDAHHCGVEYPNGIDRRRLDQSLTTLAAKPDRYSVTVGTIGVTEKGVLPLESLLIARYQMFRAVYWQHTVRAMTVMLQEAVESYIAPGQNPVEINERRLQALLRIFRTEHDADALAWLATKLPARVQELCRGVAGQRDAIFWEIADFRGGREVGVGLVGEVIEHDEALYERLVRQWSRDAKGLDGIELIRARRRFRSNLTANITAKLRTRLGNRSPTLRPDDVLLDVPVAGKDEVADLFVSQGDDRPPVPLDRTTPIARAVADAFAKSVRPARVFVRPSLARRLCTSTTEHDHLSRLVREEVESLVDAQLQFPVMQRI